MLAPFQARDETDGRVTKNSYRLVIVKRRVQTEIALPEAAPLGTETIFLWSALCGFLIKLSAFVTDS